MVWSGKTVDERFLSRLFLLLSITCSIESIYRVDIDIKFVIPDLNRCEVHLYVVI